ncbi:MAG: hypothetical protein IJ680_07490 [Paludibacteraceae bacterium]|nr:hypothetical protein [Paludibacteraceae bacterium]
MKHFKFVLLACLAATLLPSCQDDSKKGDNLFYYNHSQKTNGGDVFIEPTEKELGKIILSEGRASGKFGDRHCVSTNHLCVIFGRPDQFQFDDYNTLSGDLHLLYDINDDNINNFDLKIILKYLDSYTEEATELYNRIKENGSLDFEEDIEIDLLSSVYQTPFARTLTIPAGSYGTLTADEDSIIILTDVKFGDHVIIEASSEGWKLSNDSIFYNSTAINGFLDNGEEENMLTLTFSMDDNDDFNVQNFFSNYYSIIKSWKGIYTIEQPEVLDFLGIPNTSIRIDNSSNTYIVEDSTIVVKCSYY